MIIYLDQIRKYQKFLTSYSGADMTAFNALYLNFDDSCIDFSVGELKGRVKFKYELEEGEKSNNLVNRFLDTTKFIALANTYDKLRLDENFIFHSLSEEHDFIRIGTLQNNNFDLSLDKYNYITDWVHVPITPKRLSILKEANKYVGKNPQQKNYNGARVYADTITATDGFKFYEADFRLENSPVLMLHHKTLDAIILGSMISQNVEIFVHDEVSKILIDGGEVELYLYPQINLILPDTKSEKFIQKYDHLTYFEIDRSQLLSLIKFFEPFIADMKNQYFEWTIANKKLTFNHNVRSDQISRSIEIEFSSEELENHSFLISASLAKELISSLSSDTIRVQVGFPKEGESIGINFTNIVSEEEKLDANYYFCHYILLKNLQ